MYISYSSFLAFNKTITNDICNDCSNREYLSQFNLLCIIYLFALYIDINMCNLAYIHISYCVND